MVGAVVVAAPGSGSGKTTIATGIMGALRNVGMSVAPFKIGPDYIDPGYHSLASGRPGRNLDSVMLGSDAIVPLLKHGSAGCDVAVVEGVMGLFDGRIDLSENAFPPAAAEGSTASVAATIGAPVILVIDARGQSQSIGAVLHGFSTYDDNVRIGAVILNRVGSDRHEQVLRQSCERVGIPVVGSLPRSVELDVPSRHLGLITATEYGSAAGRAVAAMTELVEKHVDVAAVARLAATARIPAAPAWSPEAAVGSGSSGAERPVIAVAGGPAFTFAYAEHSELLAAAGADVVTFDPRHDRLPPRTAGLVLPGGFPEEHAAELAANDELLNDVRAGASGGMPIHGECAGLLYLGATLDGHTMAGVLDADASFSARLTLGYRSAVALTDSVLFRVGERVTGHEFHRTHLVRSAEALDPAWGWSDKQAPVREGVVSGSVHASYLHTHPASVPHAIGRFVDAGRRYLGDD
ncbi:hydrogenobyrinate a,c-diamide synthase [Rhodococcoides trifolii]|uniref:Hydrogenobyrinate a,c-diamide synthase n=1 Tax=Rhodococcoides trifolii TaxID=908250 RepID=A0A917D233_9NOCA|nr:cobyrinate a,c-diamide synthase [Rhodococcus trifolii]GGG07513.1 hydrogenobyrinate a,c-diamide synthase [Rhodococcus trifolii]